MELQWNSAPAVAVAPPRRLAHVRYCSPFAAALLDQHPDWADGLDVRQAPDAADLRQHIEAHDLDRGLRLFRNHQMLRIIWRDLCGLASLDETFADLTGLAELCLDAAIEVHEQRLQDKHGVPTNEAGERQRLCVIGFGKLGGGELNLSSDIDVMFCFADHGECRGGDRRSLSNDQYFIRLARAVIASLADVTEDGFCFRVDARLRPFGDSGPLCSSLAAMEQYYQREGRDWERYALIKARPVAGDRALGQQLMRELQPFVYRRYIDFSAVEALQEMHANVRDDALRKDRLDDIKRGPGGIREIEFLVQCFQLLRGGREPLLQTPSLRRALAAIAELGLLEPAVVDGICSDYVALRQLENRVQALRDQQTHRVPRGADLPRLVQAMGQHDAAPLLQGLEAVRHRVAQRFHDIFPARPPPATDTRWTEAWRRLQGADQHAGATDDDPALPGPLKRFVHSLERLPLSQRASSRLGQFMPMLLQLLEQRRLDDATLNRVLDLVLTVSRRSAYLLLLVQNPRALERMVDLFARSEWVAEKVTRYPALLDELIDPSLGRQIPADPELRASVTRLLAAAPGTEMALEGLNALKLATALRIAVAQLEGALDGEAAQAALASLAAAVLQGVLTLATQQIQQRHGRIPAAGDDAADSDSLAVIAYGSFGGGELGYDSDLDLVFLFDGHDPPSDGPRSLSPERYYARLAQRLLSFLTVMTPAGRLYAVDTRLRPNGRAGSLVSSLQAFAEYQQAEAWTWELQALTRARYVAGCGDTGRAFRVIRRAVLARPRDASALRADLASMREKMAAAPAVTDSAVAKHRAGGLIDIEFIVQFGVLAMAAAEPEVLEATATLDQLACLAGSGWISAADAQVLSDTARALRQQRMLQTLVPAESVPPVDTTASATLFATILGSAEQA